MTGPPDSLRVTVVLAEEREGIVTQKHFAGLVGLLAVAAFAVMPVVAQAAPPELGRCVKVAAGSGKYAEPGCEKKVVGTKAIYEWEPGAIEPGFTSTEGKSTFETVGKLKITCTSDTDEGEYTGIKTDSEIITFVGCKYDSYPCQNTSSAGEIVTEPLTSVLGFIKKPKEVGVSLEGPAGVFAEFKCGDWRVSINGSVIAKVTPISKMTLTFTEAFKATAGKQKPENFEGEPKDTLTCTFEVNKLVTSEQCGFTSKDTITNEEELEINEVF